MSAALRLRPAVARALALPLRTARPLCPALVSPASISSSSSSRTRSSFAGLPFLQATTTTSPPSRRLFSNTSAPPPPPEVTIDGRTYKTDRWFNVPANVIAAAGRRLHLQPDHPIAITRQIIEATFPAPTFKYHNSLHPVVSTFQNFDSLGFAADHPGRSRSDTYYINKDTLLRTHTSAHELETFRANASRGFLLSADVYRRDEVDRTHYPVFHQMEGARVWDRATDDADANGDLAAAILADLAALPEHGIPVEDANPPFHAGNPRQADAGHSAAEVEALGRHLKRSLELMVVDVFTRAAAAGGESSSDGLKMRWVEAFFPFTSPSWELEVFYEGDWLEVLGCGISQQPILNAAGVPSQIGWAFGIGLDRIAMLLFHITDIRLFWSTDERFLSQTRGVSADLSKLKRVVPFSKHPACYKDVSFWLPDEADIVGEGIEGENDSVHNDVMEIIRGIAGDRVEDVKLIDSFTHPKTQRRSRCYRINYRSLERTLTNAETNEMQAQVVDALASQLGVVIR